MFFYPIHPEKTFAYVARTLIPAAVRKEMQKNYSLPALSKSEDALFYWSIDLVKVPESPIFTSTFCVKDARGLYKAEETTQKLETREAALTFLALPSRLFEPTRVSCLIFNRKSKNWDLVREKILGWCADDDSKYFK